MLTPANDTWTLAEAAHLLNRAGFGSSPVEIRAFHGLGRTKAVDSLLKPAEPADAMPPPAWAAPEQAVAGMRAFLEQVVAMRRAMRQAATPEEAEKIRRESTKESQQENRRQGIEAQAWWFRRMLRTRAPLREKMTLFWHDHFATSIQKVRQPVFMVWQNQLFRRHAFGSFRDLTMAMLTDPAMALYLDAQNSRAGHPNENFAREIMELFTLGEGNYSENDIREAARAFTGYQLNRADGTVSFNRRKWDPGPKTVLGRTGAFTGPDIIGILFEQPAAARLVPSKLWSYFVAENPPPARVDDLARIFRDSGFQTGPLLRAIFLSKEFYAPRIMRDQIKAPVQFLVTLLKQLEIAEPPAGLPILGQQQLGQVLFMPPNVAGWDWGKAWINTNTLLTRYNIAGFLTKGISDTAFPAAAGEKVKGANGARAARRLSRWSGPNYRAIAPPALRGDPEALVNSLVARFFQGSIDPKHRAAFAGFAKSKQENGLTDPDIAELCHLMLSTPEYQLC